MTALRALLAALREVPWAYRPLALLYILTHTNHRGEPHHGRRDPDS